MPLGQKAPRPTPEQLQAAKLDKIRKGRLVQRNSVRKRRPGPLRKSSRVRDLAFLAYLHTVPCEARSLPGHVCRGELEADHVGKRGLGQKSSDRECVSLCSKGHWERQNAKGPFASMTRAERDAWKFETAAKQYAAYLSAGGKRTW